MSDEAAAFAVLGAVALHGFRKVAFQPGESCAVVGLGVVGQLLVQLAKAAGARPVVGIDLVASRRERARGAGPTPWWTPPAWTPTAWRRPCSS